MQQDSGILKDERRLRIDQPSYLSARQKLVRTSMQEFYCLFASANAQEVSTGRVDEACCILLHSRDLRVFVESSLHLGSKITVGEVKLPQEPEVQPVVHTDKWLT
jgi:hypothetical protein